MNQQYLIAESILQVRFNAKVRRKQNSMTNLFSNRRLFMFFQGSTFFSSRLDYITNMARQLCEQGDEETGKSPCTISSPSISSFVDIFSST